MEETKSVVPVDESTVQEIKAVKLKDALHTANEVKETIGIAAQDVKDGKLQVGTVSRLVALILVWANQLILLYGGTNYAHLIPEVSESTIYLISVIITMVVSIYCYIKDNPWSKEAKTSEIVLNAIKDSGITVDEVVGAVDNVIDEHYRAKAEVDTKAEVDKLKETSIEAECLEETATVSDKSNESK